MTEIPGGYGGVVMPEAEPGAPRLGFGGDVAGILRIAAIVPGQAAAQEFKGDVGVRGKDDGDDASILIAADGLDAKRPRGEELAQPPSGLGAVGLGGFGGVDALEAHPHLAPATDWGEEEGVAVEDEGGVPCDGEGGGNREDRGQQEDGGEAFLHRMRMAVILWRQRR